MAKQTNNPNTRVGNEFDMMYKRIVGAHEILRIEGGTGLRDRYLQAGTEPGYNNRAYTSDYMTRQALRAAGLRPINLTKITKERARQLCASDVDAISANRHGRLLQDAIANGQVDPMDVPAHIHYATKMGVLCPALGDGDPGAAEAPVEVEPPAPTVPTVLTVAQLQARESAGVTKIGHRLAAWSVTTDYASTECINCGATLVVGTPHEESQQQVWGAAATVPCKDWLLKTQNGNVTLWQQMMGVDAEVIAETVTQEVIAAEDAVSADDIAALVGAAVAAALASRGIA